MNTQYESHMPINSQSNPEPVGFDFMSKLPTILRMLGTGALLVAMYTFLIKGWQSGNDILRYFLMLGHTGVLAIIGLASAQILKESKGARLLLTLALVSVPVNFAILGAFLFSQYGIQGLAQYPEFVAWSADSLQAILMTTGIGVLILIPISLLGFSVLARSISKRLTLLFLVSNAVLLIPIRDPFVIGILVLVLAIIGIVFFHRSLQKHVASKTKEGITALMLQALPLAILLGRTLWLYSADLFLLLVLCLAVYLLLRQICTYLDRSPTSRSAFEVLSLLPALGSFPITFGLLADTVTAALIYDIARNSVLNTTIYRWIAAVTLGVGIFLNMYIEAGTLSSLIAIAAGIGLLILGYQNKQRGLFIIGSVMMIVGITHQLFYLIRFFDLGSWASLAILGVVAIVVGSVIESKGAKIQHRFVQLKDNFLSWDS